MSGILEETLRSNIELKDIVKELITKIDQLQVKDTSWVDVKFIKEDLKTSHKDFHGFWKDRMPFLRRAKGKGSNYRAIRWEYEEWKQKYWDALKIPGKTKKTSHSNEA